MPVTKIYQQATLDDDVRDSVESLLAKHDVSVGNVLFEYCFYVETQENKLTDGDRNVLKWLIEQPFAELLPETNMAKFGPITSASTFSSLTEAQSLLFAQLEIGPRWFEIGPRLNYSTPWSTNAVSICHTAGLTHITRMERSRRYTLCTCQPISKEVMGEIVAALHDQMTEMLYERPVKSFELTHNASEVYEVDVMNDGRKALDKVNQDMGLAMDDWDLDFYAEMFKTKIGRNPTNVECFDLAQSNSEHCRHWFFGGRLVIDGEEKDNSLFKLVKATQENTNPNNKIKFSDNSSCIEGFEVKSFRPADAGKSSPYVRELSTLHVILTAETHNFPTAVAPFPGATTGTGGRIRDVQATGRGAHVVAGTAGYCFGCLNIPDYELPWEDKSAAYPPNFASPLSVIIDGSNGASDYGNKYGEPVLCGFARSFGLKVGGERREWVKPIMFSGGIGSIHHEHLYKKTPEIGDLVVKVGGPVYRIGVGGGAASSVQVQGDNAAELDLAAVQRGDAEMEQKMNRIIRACIEKREDNPILSIHDQGAGGNGNVLKEICEPKGAIIHCDSFQLGDPTISVLELWGAEYQETNAFLTKPESREFVEEIARREKCEASFVGEVTGNGKIQLTPFGYHNNKEQEEVEKENKKHKPALAVDLDLQYVLGDMPKKVFNMSRRIQHLEPLVLPDEPFQDILERVLRLPAVASKRYLTNKVDRSVTGLVAQQQCVGPLHTPLADVAVTSLSFWDTKGAATAIGEQPIKMLVSNECGARMAVGESLTNLSFALITQLKDVKCSANWMWPAKLEGEGPKMYDACEAMCGVMRELGIAIDGGKDSLSMAARVGDETAKAPGSLVISTYAACTDIRKTVTPDLKCPQGQGDLLHINLSKGQRQQRLGGSALAQVYKQVGNESPDLDDSDLFTRCFQAIQRLIKDGLICAGHDVSDGGVLVCLLEMAFAGNSGCNVTFTCNPNDRMSLAAAMFNEELGYVLEVKNSNLEKVSAILNEFEVNFKHLGVSTSNQRCVVSAADSEGAEAVVLDELVNSLRDEWEDTSFVLDLHQCSAECVGQERKGMLTRTSPPYKLTFTVMMDEPSPVSFKMAVVRDEGTNGDRELAAAFFTAGFEVHDVTMTDLVAGSVSLDKFQGLAFAGGFAHADVLGSAKGWVASVMYNKSVMAQFEHFYNRKDTFSLGVCNGCQVMTLLGWVGHRENSGVYSVRADNCQVYMGRNLSTRYESRFTTVRIDDSPSLMLKGMNGSTLGIWVAHGEGRMTFRSADVYSSLVASKLLPIKYVSDSNSPTIIYPFNPNGSPGGVAALCSPDGRHLALMPHPERSFQLWQWPWMPEEWKETVHVSPWLKMFQNAYDWCREMSHC